MTAIDVNQIALHESFKETIRLALESKGYGGNEDVVTAVAEDILAIWVVSERGDSK